MNKDFQPVQLKRKELEASPYVLVDNCDIENNGGTGNGNLYFVAKDVFSELWQQQIVAYHETFCQRQGHEYAKTKEIELAKALEKEEEWLKIREKIDNGF